MPKLAITDAAGFRELALGSEVKAGRSSTNDVVLDVPEASRQHCRFFKDGSAWFVEDLGSSNGTLVNGRKVSKFELQDGDVISVGSVSIRFLDAGVEASEPAVEDGWGEDEISLEQDVVLVLGTGSRRGEVVKISGESFTVGRKPRNALVLSDPSVSGDHAELRKKGSGWMVKDLGSSNGTKVDGEPVEEAELASGSVVTFGSFTATFGIGAASDFAPPPEALEEAPDEPEARTVIAPAFDMGGASFEVKVPPKRSDTVFNIVMLLVIVGLLGGVGYLWMRNEARNVSVAGASRHVASNLVPEKWWSFEPVADEGESAEAEGWKPLDPADPTSVGMVDGPSGVAMTLARAERGPTPGIVRLEGASGAVDVAAGRAFRVTARVRADSGADAGLCLDWLNADESVAVRDVLPAGESTDFKLVSGVFADPGGYTKVRVGLILAGRGEAAFDDVSVEAVDPPPDSATKAGNLAVAMGSSGAVRATRPGRVVFRDFGAWSFRDPKAPAGPGFGGPTPAVGGLKATLTGEPATIGWELAGASGETDFAAVVPGSPAEVTVTTVEGETGVRRRGPFAASPASAVIVGDAGARVRLRFVAMDGSAASIPVSLIDARGVAVLVMKRGAATSFRCAIDTSFEAELSAAGVLLAKAREAERAGRFGEALSAFGQVLARFPFEDRIESEARTAVDRLAEVARNLQRDFEARADDARFFRTIVTDGALIASVRDAAGKWKGAPVGDAFEQLAQTLEKDRVTTSGARATAEAQASLLRAIDYAGDPRGRRDVAAALFESVIRRHPGSESARDAEARLSRLRSAGEGNK
ncbi:MAG: hypothetical protein RIS21_501 [Planctomycetota bacterium]|jgi:pSer/pThr/pTyr-binding forkhead associated (FHA) protein